MSERLPDDVAATLIERDEVPVMFLRARDELVEIRRGWERLEALVGLRGRKFFGAFDASTQEYRVCVQVREDDDPAALGLESGTFPADVTCEHGFAASRRKSTSESARRSQRLWRQHPRTRHGRASSSTATATRSTYSCP